MKEFDSRYQFIMFWVLASIIAVVAAFMLEPFVPSLVWGIVLAVLMHPIFQRFGGSKRPNVAAFGTTMLALAIIGLPLLAIGAAMFVQVNGFVQDLQGNAPAGQSIFDLGYLAGQLDKSFGSTLHSLSPNFTFSSWFEQNRDSVAGMISAPVGKVLASSARGALTFVVAFLSMFYMVRDGHKLKQPVLALIPLPHPTTEDIIGRLGRTIRAVFKSVILVGMAQGLLAGGAYWVAGVPNAFMWCIATIVLCMVPLLGAPIVYLPLSLALVAQGHMWNGLGLAAFCLAIVSNIDNLLKPWIIGSEVDLHPLAVFFALLGGVFFFGPVGLMAGPLVLTLAIAINDVLQERRKLAKQVPDAY